MSFKKFLLGSIAATSAVTGARAADAIVIPEPEPEPMEYVRICDVYGAGFFYIPGTENCLAIGGYMRYEVTAFGSMRGRLNGEDSGYTTLARFAPTFDVRSETAWGTLRGFAEIEFNWGDAEVDPANVIVGSYGGNSTELLHAFIEIGNPAGVLRVGKTENPFARFLDFGHAGWIDEGNYGYNASPEISYTFSSGAFQGVVALIEDEDDTNWMPNVEAGMRYNIADESFIGLIAGYDDMTETWGGKVALQYTAGPAFAKIIAYYSDHDNLTGKYTILDSAGRPSDWVVQGDIGYAFSPQIRLGLAGEYFIETDAFEAGAQIAYRPFGSDSLLVKTEGRYYSDIDTATGDQDAWGAFLRFDRNF